LRKPFLLPLAATALGLLALQPATAETLRIDPHSLKRIAHVDPRYQSYNIEMAAVAGVPFWKPYSSSGGKGRSGRDKNPFAKRPPFDLHDRRLRVLAAALGPAYLRVSGSWANSVFFQNGNGSELGKPPAGYRGVLTRNEWRGVVDFARAVNARLVTSFSISQGVRGSSGDWTPVEARPLVTYTRSIGGQLYAAELFNEPNVPAFGAGPPGYDAARFAADEAAFSTFVATYAAGLKIVGPGSLVTGAGPVKLPIPVLATRDLLAANPAPQFDIYSYHFYGAVSPRCAPARSPLRITATQALSDAWLARTEEAFETQRRLRDRFAPHAPIWLTETADAACGGDPWADTFLDSFRYLDQLARLARDGVGAVFHNTLVGSDYGLLVEQSFVPRPNYWAALLWRKLMGTVVLNAPGLWKWVFTCMRNVSGEPQVASRCWC